jgi:hypothetical protein
MFALCSLLPERRRQSLASVPIAEPITSVEEFAPDEGMLDRSFLEDMHIQERGTPQHLEAESDRYLLVVQKGWGTSPCSSVTVGS